MGTGFLQERRWESGAPEGSEGLAQTGALALADLLHRWWERLPTLPPSTLSLGRFGAERCPGLVYSWLT